MDSAILLPSAYIMTYIYSSTVQDLFVSKHISWQLSKCNIKLATLATNDLLPHLENIFFCKKGSIFNLITIKHLYSAVLQIFNADLFQRPWCHWFSVFQCNVKYL